MSPVVSTTLLLGGVALLATWLVTPAGSSPDPARPAAQQAGAAQTRSDAANDQAGKIDEQVQRLRERLPAPAALPAARRDPFNFGNPPAPATVDPMTDPSVEAALVEPPAPILPTLVAILSDTIDGAPVRIAVVAAGDDVQLLKMGDRAGAWRVTAIGGESAVFTSDALGQSFTVALQ
jgi:hypothetical protein